MSCCVLNLLLLLLLFVEPTSTLRLVCQSFVLSFVRLLFFFLLLICLLLLLLLFLLLLFLFLAYYVPIKSKLAVHFWCTSGELFFLNSIIVAAILERCCANKGELLSSTVCSNRVLNFICIACWLFICLCYYCLGAPSPVHLQFKEVWRPLFCVFYSTNVGKISMYFLLHLHH